MVCVIAWWLLKSTAWFATAVFTTGGGEFPGYVWAGVDASEVKVVQFPSRHLTEFVWLRNRANFMKEITHKRIPNVASSILYFWGRVPAVK